MVALTGAGAWPSDTEAAVLYRFSVRSSGPLTEQRKHGRRILDEVAARFEEIGSGGLEPPELVRLIASLERELRWVLDELDRVDEERSILEAHRRVAAFGGS